MTTNLCKNCKFWDPPVFYDTDSFSEITTADKLYIGTCIAVPLFSEAVEDRFCENPKIKEGCDSLAFAQDASDYNAVLYTKPDFGCVMFQKK